MTVTRLTDLLPPERRRAFLRNYFFRLGTIAAVIISVLLLIHGVLLTPAYFHLSEAKANEVARLSAVKERLESSGDQEIVARLTSLNAQTEHLAKLSDVPSASATIRSILALPRAGIALTGFAFTPAQGKNPGQMRVTGTAASRESLRAYQSTLATLPSVTAADLPIGAYAKESDIPFTVTLSGTFAPVSP